MFRRSLITAFSALELHRVEVVESTMDAIIPLLPLQQPKPNSEDEATGDTKVKVVGLLADEQTAARGTGNRAWKTGKGNLQYTFAIPRVAIPDRFLPMLPMIVGLSMRESVLEQWSAKLKDREEMKQLAGALRLKWPNDVLLGDSKLGGVLITEHSGGAKQSFMLIGIGINVAFAPPVADGGRTAASVSEIPERLGLKTLHGGDVVGDHSDTALVELASAITTKIMTRIELGHRGVTDPRATVIAEFDRLMAKDVPLFRRNADGTRGRTVLPIRLKEWGELVVKDVENGDEDTLLADYLL